MARTPGSRRPDQPQGTNPGQHGGQQNITANGQQPEVQYTYVTKPGQQNRRSGGLTPAQRKAREQRRKAMLRRQRRHRRTVLGLLLLLIIGGAFFGIRYLTGGEDTSGDSGLDVLDQTQSQDDEEQDYDGPAEATIAFVGDISTSASQIADVTKSDGTYDFSTPFAEVSSYISGADYAVGSFETTMVDGLSYGGEPYYNSPVQLAGTLKNLGFRLVSTANTYMLNNGISGLTSTKNYLTEAGIQSVGTYLSQEERDENGGAYIRTIHKIKFAFLSYTKGTDSVMMPEGCEYALNTLYSDYSDYWTDLKSSQIKADVQAAKDAGAEVIVALVHWGSEYGRSVSQPQEEVAELLLKNGVDVIVGTHSHLVSEMGFQKVTRTDGTTAQCFVAYNIGDFYTDPEKESAQTSVILNLTFSKNASGNVSMEASYVPIYQYITEVNGKRHFQVLDIYQNIATLYRAESMTSQQAQLYNQLLDAVDTLHNYAGEDLDAGPQGADLRVVQKALEEGEISTEEIKALQKEEQEAEEKAKAAIAAAKSEDGEDVDTDPDTENAKDDYEEDDKFDDELDDDLDDDLDE
jgi:poly-gamma-glutamate synthesis protein (capsule biosynthesis protein)